MQENHVKIGMAQIEIPMGSYESNKEKCRHFFEDARRAGVDILVFPEMTLTGFDVKSAEIARRAEDTKRFFEESAKKSGLHIVYGYAQQGERKLRNHLNIASPEGALMDYEKIHPFSLGQETELFDGGDKICWCRMKGHCFSGAVCYDLRFPEIFQEASKQAECIFVIANWPMRRIRQFRPLLQARAIENLAYVVGVNCTGVSGGVSYNGMSAAYRPDGELVSDGQTAEGLVAVDLDFGWLSDFCQSFPYKRDRRPELYRRFYPS